MEIETKTASLETFSVTIRALHVNGKQMTLAVFRQLPTGQEQDGDEKWGTVRYTIKDTGDVWLVFSHEGHLCRRAIVTRCVRTGWSEESCRGDIVDAEKDRAKQRKGHAEKIRQLRMQILEYEQWSREPKQTWRAAPEELAKMAVRRSVEITEHDHAEQKAEAKHARNLLALQADLVKAQQINQREKDRAAYDQSLIDTLPQLFIAV